MQQSLLNNRGDTLWERILEECSADEFENLMTIHGFSAVESAQRERRATIFVHYHGVFTPLFWILLRHRGLGPGTIIGRVKRHLQAQKITSTVPTRGIEHVRHLVSARRTLAEGGTVHILPDGYRGTGGIEVNFFGRKRTFRTGFAELALMTGATIIPVFVSLDLQERFRLDVLEPLDSGIPSPSRTDQVESLVRQYATLLQAQWLQEPANIKWLQMLGHLDWPLVTAYGERDLIQRTT